MVPYFSTFESLFFFFHGPDGDDDRQVGVIGLLGPWERLFSPVEYPHIIVKLVPHIYQRVIDLAFLHSASSVWLSGFGKILKESCDVLWVPPGGRGSHPGLLSDAGIRPRPVHAFHPGLSRESQSTGDTAKIRV